MTFMSQQLFQNERPKLIALAYRMLGEVSAAEDIVQEAWIRLSSARQQEIAIPSAWLRRVVTNLALDELRSARARREVYVGPWLPEPIVSTQDNPAEAHLALAQECSLALLWAMDVLGPRQRAAFVLREAFDDSYEDIACTLGCSVAAARQMVSRAHAKLAATRNDVAKLGSGSGIDLAPLVTALAMADVDAARACFAADAIAISDGGAKRRAARRPLVGPAEIVHVSLSVLERSGPANGMRACMANGTPALAWFQDGVVESIICAYGHVGHEIGWLYTQRNPDKLPDWTLH